MAVISFSSSYFVPGIKMGSENFDFAFGNGSGTFSSTALIFSDGTATATFTGTDLVPVSFFGFLTDIQGGTLTGFEANDAGNEIMAITNWSVDAAKFYDLATASNWQALWALILSGNDDVTGTTGRDRILGGAGRDDLNGGRGADAVNGGAGKDTVAGGSGHDILTGGAAADHFLFNTDLSNENTDTVKDFRTGVDKVELDHTIFESLAIGKLTSDHFVPGTAAADEDDFLIYDKASGNLFYDRDGSQTKHGPELIASFGAGTAIVFEDVLISA